MAKQFQSVQSVQKARTIASFVKKNNHLFKQSSNYLANFLCLELSKCNSNKYTYRIDNVEIGFYLYTQNGDARQGGYLFCCIWDNYDSYNVFNSFETGVRYNDGTEYKIIDKVINGCGREVNRSVLFEWDKIIECMG